MPKLTYWKAESLDDSNCYSIRAKTKKDCKAQVQAMGEYASSYGAPEKVEIEYKDKFDLMSKCLDEYGISFY